MEPLQRKIMLALLISTFLAAIEVTIVSTAMPKIVRDLGGFELISWVFAIYLLSAVVTTPIWGKLADLFGRKKIYISGVIIFLIGSALCGFAPNMAMLIFFRFIQGIGAGAINPVTFTIIADVFNFEQRAKVQGLVSSMWGIAGVFGPVIGGLIVDFLTWRWIFFINLPFGLIAMWMIGKYLQETIEKRKRKIDYGGAITFTVAITTFLLVLLTFSGEAGEVKLGTGAMLLLLLVSVLFFGLFLAIQKRHPEPMMPLKLFKIKDVVVPIIGAFLTSIILIGLTAYLPLWTQNVLQMGATSSGFTLIPLCLGWPLGAMICGKIIPRIGIKNVALLGISLIVTGSILLTFIGPATPLSLLVIIILLIGIGFGFAVTSFTVIIQSSVAIEIRGAAGGLNTLMRTLGQTIGVAILGAAMNYTIFTQANGGEVTPLVMAAGLHTIFVISAVVSLIGLLVTFFIPKREAAQYMN